MTPPIALLLSAGGVAQGDRRWYTWVTLFVSGLLTLLIAWSMLAR